MKTTEIIAVAAIAGTLAGTLAGAWLQSFLSGRRQRSAELRALTTQLYVELAVYTQRAEAFLDWLTGEWPFRRHPTVDERPDTDLLTARVQLLTPTSVQEPWAKLLQAEEVLEWNVTENGGYDPDGQPIADDDQNDVVAVRAAIKQLKAAARAAIGR